MNCGSEERVSPDAHPANVEHDAVKVEKYSLAKFDIGPIVAEERRLHPDGFSAFRKQLHAELFSERFLGLPRSIQALAQVARTAPGCSEFRVESVIKLAGEHLFPFGAHAGLDANSRSARLHVDANKASTLGFDYNG